MKDLTEMVVNLKDKAAVIQMVRNIDGLLGVVKNDIEGYIQGGDWGLALATFSSHCDYRMGADEVGDDAYINVIGEMIKCGADLDCDPKGRAHSPLYSEARKGNLVAVKMLLEGGAEVDGRFWSNNPFRCTPLMLAAQGGFRDVVECLLAHGADVNRHDRNGDMTIDYTRVAGFSDVEEVLNKWPGAVQSRKTGNRRWK